MSKRRGLTGEVFSARRCGFVSSRCLFYVCLIFVGLPPVGAVGEGFGEVIEGREKEQEDEERW